MLSKHELPETSPKNTEKQKILIQIKTLHSIKRELTKKADIMKGL